MDKQTYGIDLHIHTTSSDGTRTVSEMIQDALEYGLSHIAITDHNQFAITEPFCVEGLEIIPGAEFSTAYTTEAGRLLEVHIVGLFFDGIPSSLRQIFKKIPQQRKQYLDAIVTKLNHLGIAISYEELVCSFPDSNQIGRRHVAEILVKKNYAYSINDAFEKFLSQKSIFKLSSSQGREQSVLITVHHLLCCKAQIHKVAAQSSGQAFLHKRKILFSFFLAEKPQRFVYI